MTGIEHERATAAYTAAQSEQPNSVMPSPLRRRWRVARWIALAMAVALVSFAVVLATRIGNHPTYSGGRILDKPAPDLTLPLLSGGTIDTGELRGKSVIVNFWNTWCIPCQREAPALKAFAADHQGDPSVVLLAIVRDDTRDAVEQYAAREKNGWKIAFDPESRAALDFGTTGQPETYAIAPDGVVVAQQFGEVSVANLETMLACTKGRC